MEFRQIEENIDFVLSAAMKKCGNPSDAEDLAGETILAAVTALSQGKSIGNMRGWLTTVLQRRFYDMLRRRNRLPTVSWDSSFDIADERREEERQADSVTMAAVRRELACLSSQYREVTVRHYLRGESVESIACELHIPAGTVKSRLSVGRAQMKKGLDAMEDYMEQSYRPQGLHLSSGGGGGMNGEPNALVNGDLIVQNLLILAYEKPVTEAELSKAIGIAAAYIEPIVRKLVDNELMKRVGNRVYTDFIIFKPEEQFCYRQAQKEYAARYFDLYWRILERGLAAARAEDFYQRFNEEQKRKFELYFVMQGLDYGVFGAAEKFVGEQVCPTRPNGGTWIAFGFIKNDRLNSAESRGLEYSGRNGCHVEDYRDAKELTLFSYSMKYGPGPTLYLNDYDLAKFLYVVEHGVDYREADCNWLCLTKADALIEAGLLRREADGLHVDIPVFTGPEYDRLWEIQKTTSAEMTAGTVESIADYLKGKAVKLPGHLKSVPGMKQYMRAMDSIPMALVDEAVCTGRLGPLPKPCPAWIFIERI